MTDLLNPKRPAIQFGRWINSTVKVEKRVLDRLKKRRAAEGAMFEVG